MTSTTTAAPAIKSNAPTHKLYRVIKGRTEHDKDIWSPVAVCWPHKDGNGFSVKFNFNEAPSQGAEYVMRRDRRSAADRA